MKKNGFTLVELLAVIVILAMLMTIIGVSLSEPKKEAHKKEVQKMEETIKNLGADFYIDNRDKFSASDKYKVPLSSLKSYLKNIECKINGDGAEVCSLINPANNDETCEAYLLVDTTDSNDMFGSYVNCDGLYETKLQDSNITDYIIVN